MIKMEPKYDKANPVEDDISRHTEKLISHGIEILRITLNKTQPYEIKIKEVDDEKYQDCSSGPEYKS